MPAVGRKNLLVLGALCVGVVLVGVLLLANLDTPTRPQEQSDSSQTQATLPVGARPPSAADSVRQELPEPCTQKVEPIREMVVQYPDSFALTEQAAQALNAAIGEAIAACGFDDWKRFNDGELRAWLSPARPGATPSGD